MLSHLIFCSSIWWQYCFSPPFLYDRYCGLFGIRPHSVLSVWVSYLVTAAFFHGLSHRNRQGSWRLVDLPHYTNWLFKVFSYACWALTRDGCICTPSPSCWSRPVPFLPGLDHLGEALSENPCMTCSFISRTVRVARLAQLCPNDDSDILPSDLVAEDNNSRAFLAIVYRLQNLPSLWQKNSNLKMSPIILLTSLLRKYRVGKTNSKQ